jgi:predicted TIM-barrel fold metal-dependent hydrolase
MEGLAVIIDAHTHIYDDTALHQYRRKSGGRVTKILTFPYFKTAGPLKDLAATLDFAARHEGVYTVGTIDMDAPIGAQIDELSALFTLRRIHGIKLYPGYQQFFPYDPSVDAIAELCAQFGKPLIFHGGVTYSEVKNTRLKFSRPEHVDEIAVRHPRTNFVIAHFGFPHFMDTAAVLSDNDNVYADLSAVIYGDKGEDRQAMTLAVTRDLERAFALFNAGPDIREKVMFASDYIAEDDGMDSVKPFFNLVDSLFTKVSRETVYFKLAERLFFS